MIKFKYTKKFKKRYSNLTQEKKKNFEKQLKYLAEDQFHPSLQTKKNYTLSKRFKRKVYESRIDKEYRFAWSYDGEDIILLLTVGDHKIVE